MSGEPADSGLVSSCSIVIRSLRSEYYTCTGKARKARAEGLMIFQPSLRLPSRPVYLPNRDGHIVPYGKDRRVRHAIGVGSDDQMERPDTGRDKSGQFDVDLH